MNGCVSIRSRFFCVLALTASLPGLRSREIRRPAGCVGRGYIFSLTFESSKTWFTFACNLYT